MDEQGRVVPAPSRNKSGRGTLDVPEMTADRTSEQGSSAWTCLFPLMVT